MKKEFIMPSLEVKKFSKVLIMGNSDPMLPSNFDEAIGAMPGKVNVEKVAVISL